MKFQFKHPKEYYIFHQAYYKKNTSTIDMYFLFSLLHSTLYYNKKKENGKSFSIAEAPTENDNITNGKER